MLIMQLGILSSEVSPIAAHSCFGSLTDAVGLFPENGSFLTRFYFSFFNMTDTINESSIK